ncbi:TSC22 domain family protein 2 isoform X1 [Astatotilapia calliptera]|uniref:TSC22 domain family member 2 n=1 Tax=Astatotilapia calliptera TaxID=8154 RepID=A0AAX7UNH2_ASTCA|nr:TSC22 domain family protein 2-like isoform X1 [Astatotilapia calliptera]
MSKMQAKKKSCFQITSVTQAQVAANTIPDDAESLDDPDESRTEDVSSEIFDGSRGELGVCDRSSSEETLSNAGESQEGQLPNTGPVNGGLSHNISMVSGRATPHSVGGSVGMSATAQPFVSGSATTAVPGSTVSSTAAQTAPVSTNFTSRFRVIKLDHGTGEPFRRGRWTCTEYYERDSDSNINRSDSIKSTLTHDLSLDRDSGLGATGNSVFTSSSQTLDTTTESGYSASVGNPAHPHPSESWQQGYSLASQIGSGASAFQPTGYTTSSSQQSYQAQVNMLPVAAQTFPSNSFNGVHQSTMQQNTSMPAAPQAQQFPYSTHQPHFGSSAQNLPVTSIAVGPPTRQVSPPVMTPTGPGSVVPGGEAASAQGLSLQAGGAPSMVAPCQAAGQTQPSGGLGIAPAPSTTTTSHSGGHNVPSTVPSITNTSPGVPSPGHPGGHIQLQGAHGGATVGLPPVFSNQPDDSGPNTDALPQHTAGVVPEKDGVNPLSEGPNPPSPAVNSLFGIHITMDMDGDRNPSTAFYQAFRPSRLRGSKPINDRQELKHSASGASVVAIDNKIEQAMDLVKSHLMYAVREEVEVLKEHIKELYERNSMLERENAVLKSLANSEQLSHLTNQLTHGSRSPPLQQQHPLVTNSTPSLVHHEGSQSVPHQPDITSA